MQKVNAVVEVVHGVVENTNVFISEKSTINYIMQKLIELGKLQKGEKIGKEKVLELVSETIEQGEDEIHWHVTSIRE